MNKNLIIGILFILFCAAMFVLGRWSKQPEPKLKIVERTDTLTVVDTLIYPDTTLSMTLVKMQRIIVSQRDLIDSLETVPVKKFKQLWQSEDDQAVFSATTYAPLPVDSVILDIDYKPQIVRRELMVTCVDSIKTLTVERYETLRSKIYTGIVTFAGGIIMGVLIK